MIIYCIRNKINNKIYIGQTVRGFDLRMEEHKRNATYGIKNKLYNAINKYGWENFECSVIDETATTKEELNALETYYIVKYDSFKNGYNMTYGGDENPMDYTDIKEKHDTKMRSKEVRDKISKTMKGVPKTQEHINHVRESLKAFYAAGNKPNYKQPLHLSDEHKEKLLSSLRKSVWCENGEEKHEFNSRKEASIWLHGYYDVSQYKKDNGCIRNAIETGCSFMGFYWHSQEKSCVETIEKQE